MIDPTPNGVEWVATGYPIEQTQWPPIAPTAANRTAVIWNRSLDPSEKFYAQNLWLTKVSTGWNLAGAIGQSRDNRIFYPRNLSQQPITLEGQMPNQFQYDLLVQFIKKSHSDALNQKGPEQKPLTFFLPAALIELPGSQEVLGLKKPLGYRRGDRHGSDTYWNGDQIVRRYYRTIYVDGYIMGIKAGHPRWNFAPKFTMDFLISQDNIDEDVALSTQLTDLVARPSTYVQDDAALSKNYQAKLLHYNKSLKGLALPSDATLPQSTPLDAIQNIGITNWFNP